MKDQFVTFEIANKLKELGFNEHCLAWFDKANELIIEQVKPEVGYFTYEDLVAPLWQQVIDWFIIKHDVIVYLDHVSLKSFIPIEGMTYEESLKSEILKSREAAILKACELLLSKKAHL